MYSKCIRNCNKQHFLLETKRTEARIHKEILIEIVCDTQSRLDWMAFEHTKLELHCRSQLYGWLAQAVAHISFRFYSILVSTTGSLPFQWTEISSFVIISFLVVSFTFLRFINVFSRCTVDKKVWIARCHDLQQWHLRAQ